MIRTPLLLSSAMPSWPHWQRIGIRHHHGIALPLFSLRNENSSGIGEYLDLIPLMQWCKQIGFDVIQLLPLSDSGGDSSPYSAHSAFALNPLYLSLYALPYLSEHAELQEMLKNFIPLNALPKLAFHEVLKAKRRFFERYFELTSPHFESDAGFAQFQQTHDWLEGYCLYKALKEEHRESAWFDWEEPLKRLSPEALAAARTRHTSLMRFHACMQYLAFEQMGQVRKSADASGILLKGDIPILISRDSADVWLNRHLFVMEYSAGAPPDMYNLDGQNWGFPLYDWNFLKQSNFLFWQKRLKVAEAFFHLVRIDHVVGFFRIWAIPNGAKPTEGHYISEKMTEWLPQGNLFLTTLLASTNMLPIGEDLGNVPDEVRTALRVLGIPGTKVMRWERKWKGDGSFIDPANYIPESMTTLSTHDSETLADWWQNLPQESSLLAKQKHWPYSSTLTQMQRFELLKDSHTSSSLFHINLLQEYLALIPSYVSANPREERINEPGLVLPTNWTYRFRPTIDTLAQNETLADAMCALTQQHSLPLS